MSLFLRLPLASLVFLFLSFSCQKTSQNTLFEMQKNSGIVFQNKVENTPEFNIMVYRNFYNGGGVGIADLDNDGLPEVLLTANMTESKLFRNKGAFLFEDITAQSGLLSRHKWATGVSFVDINHDGWLDMYICYAGYQKGINNQNELYINNHNLTFTERASEYGLAEEGFTTHAAFFDYDKDGDLDAYILKNSFIPVNTLNYSNKRTLRAEDWPVKDFLKGGGDKLLRNDEGHFVDVSAQAGIYGSLIGFGLGVTVGDVNGDSYPDLYISNDFFERDYLYINQKNGTYKEDLENQMSHLSHSSMGADMADVNNDGWLDIFTTDMLPDNDYKLKTTSLFDSYDIYRYKVQQGFFHQFMQNTLQINAGNNQFQELAFYSGVAASDWSWGGLIFDADNDGRSDIFVSNGIYHDVTNQDFMDFFANDIIQKMILSGTKAKVNEIIDKMPSIPVRNKLYRNEGQMLFVDRAESFGLSEETFSNGSAYGDLDGDGDLDLVLNNVNQDVLVYKNLASDKTSARFIQFALRDTASQSHNVFCIGALVKVFCGSEVLSRELIPTRGFQSSVEYKLTIGLGGRQIDSVRIIWPNNTLSQLSSYQIGKENVVYQPSKALPIPPAPSLPKPVLQLVKNTFAPHIENEYVDFYSERGVPMMLSRQGPQSAIGDVNHDGLDDVYISGSLGSLGMLYLQTPAGTFIPKTIKRTEHFEESAVAFLDVNHDTHLDLWIAHGGNQFQGTDRALQHLLYLGDGLGGFTLTKNPLPHNDVNVSKVLPLDFDGDGDIDVFIAGRNESFHYGLSANSYLLQNDGKGAFRVWTNEEGINPFAKLGMVTDVAYDTFKDKQTLQLLVVGEWMEPTFFEYQRPHWVQQKMMNIPLSGWWQGMSVVDVNGDGLKDVLLGNMGENFYLKANVSHPLTLFVQDFDNNGITEALMTRRIEDKDVPVFLKKELTDQIPSLKKQNLNYTEFAKKSIYDLFPSYILEAASTKITNTFSSVLLVNKTKGVFEPTPLPIEIQFSSTKHMVAHDINQDGRLDLIIGGNQHNLLPQFSALDAHIGLILMGQKDGSYKRLPYTQTGWIGRGDVRDMKVINIRAKPHLLVLCNNEAPHLYKLP